MNLTIDTPNETVVDQPVSKVTAEAPNGSFCVLPRHVDFATVLVPGILSFVTPEAAEVYVAVDEAVMVKVGEDLMVAARQALQGADLDRLEEMVEERFKQLAEREQKALQAMRKIEAGFMRGFMRTQEDYGG